MGNLFLVMTGGAIGAGLRYQVGRWLGGVPASAQWPLATFAVNVVGGLAMGLLAGWLARRSGGESLSLLLGVGVLGGFTTFSAYSLEIVRMVEGGRGAAALAYALASVVAAVLAVALGLMLARSA
jgi:fluoride exporter